jgi:hypothetical protein
MPMPHIILTKKTITKRQNPPSILAINYLTQSIVCQEGEKTEYPHALAVKEF